MAELNNTQPDQQQTAPLTMGISPSVAGILQANSSAAQGIEISRGPDTEVGFAEDGAFGVGDLLLSVPRGIAGFGSDVTNLVLLPFDAEVPNRFGMGPSRTGAGQITEGITNFLTGFIPIAGALGKVGQAGRLGRMASGLATKADKIYDASRAAYAAGNTARAAALGAKGRAVSLLPELAKVTTASAVTDFIGFDGHEARLSNFLREYAGLQDPVTEFLAASEDDSEITGRLKNAIEGTFVGVVADGLFSAVRVFRAGLRAKNGGLDPTRAMIEETARIRGEQIRKIMEATGVSEEEASVALTFIEMSGVAMSDLDIVSQAAAVVKSSDELPLWAAAQADPEVRAVRPTTEYPTEPGHMAMSEEELARLDAGDPTDRVSADWVRREQRGVEQGPEAPPTVTFPDQDDLGFDAIVEAQEQAARAAQQRQRSAELRRKVLEAARRLPNEPMRDPTTGRFVSPNPRDPSGRFAGRPQGPAPLPKYKLRETQWNNLVDEVAEQADAATRPLPDQPVFRGGNRVLGYVEFAEEGRVLLGLLKGADFETVVHEGSHIFRRFLLNNSIDPSMRYGIDDADIDLIASWAGARRAEDGKSWIWDRAAEERFADALIQFMRKNETPEGVKSEYFWHRAASFLTDIYDNVRASPEVTIDPRVAKSFDKITRERINALKRTQREAVPTRTTAASGVTPDSSEENLLFSLRPEDGYPLTKVPYPYAPSPTQPVRYSAKTDAGELMVKFEPHGSPAFNEATGQKVPIFDLSFTLGGRIRDEGRGAESVKTISTVANAIRQFVKDFQARTGELPTLSYVAETGRARVYSRMLGRLADELGYPYDAARTQELLSVPKKAAEGMRFGEVVTPPGLKPDDLVDAEGDVLFQTVPAGGGGGAASRVTLTGGAPIRPGSTGLGNPAARNAPFADLNIDRFSTVGDVNRGLRRFLRTMGDMSEPAKPLADVAAQAEVDAKALAELIGEKSSVSFDLKDVGIRTGAVRQAAAEVAALRYVAAQVMNRVGELAKKGAGASEEEVYEWLRNRLLAEAILRSVKDMTRDAARMLGAQRIAPNIDPMFRITRTEKGLKTDAIPLLPPGKPVPDNLKVPTPADPALPRSPEVGSPTNGDLAAGASSNPNTLPTSSTTINVSPAAMREAIESAGGMDAVRTAMNKAAAAMEAAGEMGVAKQVRGGRFMARYLNSTVEYWVNSILSGPVTHAVNLTSTMAATLYLPFERALGAAMRGNIPLILESVKPMLHMAQQMPEALKFAKGAFMSGRSILDGVDRISEARAGGAFADQAISAEAWGKDPASFMGQAIDFIGTLVNMPSRFLTTSDEFFKQMNYRAYYKQNLMIKAAEMFPDDIAARAKWVTDTMEQTISDGQRYSEGALVRRALKESEELIQQGKLKPDDRDEWVQKWLNEPGRWNEELGAMSQNSLDMAQYSTFQTRLDPRGSTGEIRKFSARVQSVVATWPTLRFLVPFVRTPTNLLIFALERAPISAQMINTRKAFSKIFEQSISPDAMVRADAMGRLAFGTAVAGSVLMLADSEIITGGGPSNKAEREAKMQTGWQPYSVKVGDKYISYRRADPFSTMIGLTADAVEAWKAGREVQGAEDVFNLVTGSIIAAISGNITNKTYLVGLTNFMEAFNDSDRYGEALVEQYVGGFVPNILNQSQEFLADEAVYREVRGALDSLRSRIPGLSSSLPPRRNILGEPIHRNKRLGFFFSPIEYTEVNDDVIFKELELIGHGFSRPRDVKGSVDLTLFTTEDGQQAYDRWLELHGQVKLGGLTLRDRLSRTIRSQAYQRLDAAGDEEFESPRTRILRSVISRYREAAWNQLLTESQELREAWVNDQRIRRGLRTGRSMAELQALDRSR